MPGRPRTMLHKTRMEEEQLRIQSEAYLLDAAPTYRRPRVDTKIYKVCKEIYDEFEAHVTLVGSPKRVPALHFAHVTETVSQPTLIKAKKILGIKSVRKDGRWWWKWPKYSLSEGMDKAHQTRLAEANEAELEITKMGRQASVLLAELMRRSSYIAINTEILYEMSTYNYSRNTTLRTKSDMGIVSRKVNGLWWWVWPCREVQDWLEKYLRNGRKPLPQIMEAAQKRGWHQELIKMTRLALPHIHWAIRNGVSYWFDVNHPDGVRLEKPSIVEIDFSEEED